MDHLYKPEPNRGVLSLRHGPLHWWSHFFLFFCVGLFTKTSIHDFVVILSRLMLRVTRNQRMIGSGRAHLAVLFLLTLSVRGTSYPLNWCLFCLLILWFFFSRMFSPLLTFRTTFCWLHNVNKYHQVVYKIFGFLFVPRCVNLFCLDGLRHLRPGPPCLLRPPLFSYEIENMK